MKTHFTLFFLLLFIFSQAQLTGADFDAIDSLINTAPEISLCKKDGKDDLPFMSRTPEKYSNYKDAFMATAKDAFTFSRKSHFFCDITVEVNCHGKAGNYDFSIEPRTFTSTDFENFKQLIALVQKLRDYDFKSAVYLGEPVNSKIRFRFLAKNGTPALQ